MNSYTDIRSDAIETIWTDDGWVLGPFKDKYSFLNTENVYMRWCKWFSNETRNQTELGRDCDWCEAIFLISGEIHVKYQTESVVLMNQGDYAIYDSLRHPKYNVIRNSTAIVLRWKSNFEGKIFGNVETHLDDYRQWIVGSFYDQQHHFYSQDFELKWGLKKEVPYKNPTKATDSISNYNWKSMAILTKGRMHFEFATDEAWLHECGHYVYWHPNIPHSNSTDRPSLCLTLRWLD